MQVTFRYGSGNTTIREFAEGTSLGCAIQQVRAGLGAGGNVQGFTGGVPQEDHTVLRDGMTVSLHDKACQKAS